MGLGLEDRRRGGSEVVVVVVEEVGRGGGGVPIDIRQTGCRSSSMLHCHSDCCRNLDAGVPRLNRDHSYL